MLSENLKIQRNAKGITQEELAIRLNIVRQTVSKWEKGQSVPDADMLIQIADFLDVSVRDLLGVEIDNDREMGEVAQQLSRINEQLAIINRRARRMWKAVSVVVVLVVIVSLFFILLNTVSQNLRDNAPPPSSTSESLISVDYPGLYDIDVGDTVYFENTAITRGSDDDAGSSSSAEAEGFMVVLDENTSLDTTLRLTSTYQYFYIKVVNKGDNVIGMTIGNDSSTQSANFHQIPTGTYYIWSTERWSDSGHAVSFFSNIGMYGNAYGYLCSTLDEAEAHN